MSNSLLERFFTKKNFSWFAWGTLFYTLIVILWGAYVRASFSGDGCGDHWPNCGNLDNPMHHKPAIIELLHRLSSGLILPLAVLLIAWAYKRFPAHSPVRTASVLTLLLTISEALIGAVLVKKGYTAHSTGFYRAFVMSAHLINTFFLLMANTLAAWWGQGESPLRLKGQGSVLVSLAVGFAGSIVLGISGAVTALGDMLYPAASLIEGIKQDFSPAASIIVKLRPLHPLIAISVGLYLLLIGGLMAHLRPSSQTQKFGKLIGISFLVQIGIGIVNLLLKAPIPMQLIHLVMGDLVWINLTLLAASALAIDVPIVENQKFGLEEEGLEPATWKDYLALTKPRVISLLLFTTLTAMIIAQKGMPNLLLFMAVGVGGYMAAGAANAINMVLDRDIDGKMKRTSTRPTVTRKITSPNALWFAFGLAVGSFLLLWISANLLSAVLAFSGLVFYVVVYTMLLKRRTWHNIVIGGAAGAFPPLVGWAAITNSISPLALLLFAIVFVWTPVHFWALAILLKDDYASVGIPMLPVVRGERATVVQIFGYTVLTAIVSTLPFFIRDLQVGLIYLIAAVLLNGILFTYSTRLLQKVDRPRASSLFHFSMLYLALLFLGMAIDRSIHFGTTEYSPPRHAVQNRPLPTASTGSLLNVNESWSTIGCQRASLSTSECAIRERKSPYPFSITPGEKYAKIKPCSCSCLG